MKTLSLKELVPSKSNTRLSVDSKELKELAASIAEFGVLQPLIVRRDKDNGHFEVIAGNRRYLAAKMAKLDEVPVMVVNATDQEAIEIQLVENLQRADVDPIEEAFGFKQLHAKGLTIRTIAQRVGKSRTWVADRLALSNLIPEYRKLWSKGGVDLRCLSLLARLTPQQQLETHRDNVVWHNPEALSRYIQDTFFALLKDFPFDLKDDTLHPDAGPCVKCAFRTSQNSDLFDGVTKEDACLKMECHKQKIEAFLKRREEELAKRGTVVRICLSGKPTGPAVLPRGFDKSDNDKAWFNAPKDAENTYIGLVAEAYNHNEIGKTMRVVLKCPVRGSVGSSPQEQKMKENERNARKELALDKLTRLALFRDLWEDRKVTRKTTEEKFFVLLTYAVNRLSHDQGRLICKALDIEPFVDKKASYEHRDYNKGILLWLQQFDNVDLFHFGMLLGVSGDLSVNEFSRSGDQLETIAKAYGRTLAATRKVVVKGIEDAKAKKEAERKAGREAAKNKKEAQK